MARTPSSAGILTRQSKKPCHPGEQVAQTGGVVGVSQGAAIAGDAVCEWAAGLQV
jgi:hypothetical protein